MKIQILTIKSELESAKRIGFQTTTSSKNVSRDNVVVRWGNSRIRSGEFPLVINPSAAITLNCQKEKALIELGLVVKIPERFNKIVPKGKKAIIRPIEHTAGNGFSIVKGPFIIPSYHYATEFIQTKVEYRVWFCGEKCFVAQRVALTEEDHKAYPCRSNWGYSYCFNFDKELKNQVLRAAAKIGLNCGAADVLCHKGEYFFLELNSAPSVDTNTLIRFFNNNLTALASKMFGKIEA